MNDDHGLFDSVAAPVPIPVADADLRFVHGFYRPPLSQQYLRRLHDETHWREEKIRLWGKEYLQPRLTAWYGDAGSDYSYSGVTLAPFAWTATLQRIREDIESACGHRFNSVLLNLYRNESDSVGWHSDAEAELGDNPVIASLSLGDTRIFKMRHKTRKDLKPVSLELSDGSLLLMAGTTQKCWQHAVSKERMPRGMRINLTFRTILNGK